MNGIIQRITTEPAGSPEEMALRIKREMPTLADLNNEQLEQIAKLVTAQRLTAELNTAVDLAGVDWQEQQNTFLSDAKSPHTRRAYAAAMNRLEAWANLKGLNPLTMTTIQADQFIRFLKDEGRSPASVRRDIAAVSAFYTWLERYHGAIKNPVRGTRIRPPNENKKETVIPSENDYETIMASVPAKEQAILAVLALRGLRAGALPNLELKDGKYHGKSKGKALKEDGTEGITLPAECLSAIKAAGLDIKKPFTWKTRLRKGTAITAAGIESRVNKQMRELHQNGKIMAAFSCHDFRHFFAVREYEANKDLFRLSKLLNHANVSVTQAYLKSLDVKL
jgi:site-specific recombinase XerD